MEIEQQTEGIVSGRAYFQEFGEIQLEVVRHPDHRLEILANVYNRGERTWKHTTFTHLESRCFQVCEQGQRVFPTIMFAIRDEAAIELEPGEAVTVELEGWVVGNDLDSPGNFLDYLNERVDLPGHHIHFVRCCLFRLTAKVVDIQFIFLGVASNVVTLEL